MSAATFTIGIDWDKNGTYTDMSTRVLGMQSSPEWSFGRDQARSISTVKGSQVTLVLNNEDKALSPNYSSSPYYGTLGAGKPVRITATYNTVAYILFQGYIDDYEVTPDQNSICTVTLVCIDAWTFLGQQKITTAVEQGTCTGEAIGLALDAAGWPAGSTYRDIDNGTTTIPYWWVTGESVTDVINDLVLSEGPPAIAYIDPSNGKFVFRGRHHRLLDSASLTSQATFRDTGSEPLFGNPVSYNVGFKDLVNHIEWQIDERAQAPIGVVWSTDDTITIPASSTVTLNVSTSDPFVNARTPRQDHDYTVLSGTVSSISLSQTSGTVTSISITATAGGAVYIQGMQLNAYSLPVARTYTVTSDDSTSQTNHGISSWDEDAPKWLNRIDAQAVADNIIALRKERLPVFSITVASANDTRRTQQMTRTISDRITIVESNTATNNDFFIETIEHNLQVVGKLHTTQFAAEQVGTVLDDSSNIFIIGNNTAGHRLDSGKLAH